MLILECKMNVHKRCQKNVANNCGINPKQIALLLQEMGISDPNNITPTIKPAKPAIGSVIITIFYFRNLGKDIEQLIYINMNLVFVVFNIL